MELLLGITLGDCQPLVVVVVEPVEGEGVVDDDIKQGVLHFPAEILQLHGACHGADELHHLSVVLLTDTLVDGIALDEVVLQYGCSPLTESNAPLCIDSIAKRNNQIEVIESYSTSYLSGALHSNCSEFPNSCLF